MNIKDINEFELDVIEYSLERLLPGSYSLREIIGDLWDVIQHKTEVGRQFKQLVSRNYFDRLQLGAKTVTNHQTYILL